MMYKKSRSGYTVNRNSGRQQEIPGTDSKILHIELLSGKPKFSKTQNSLRPHFLCWTHSDWDHSFGLSELNEFFDEHTHIIIPSGFQAKEFRDFLESDKNRNYQYEEYSKILNMLGQVGYGRYHTADQDSYFYSFSLKKWEVEMRMINMMLRYMHFRQ